MKKILCVFVIALCCLSGVAKLARGQGIQANSILPAEDKFIISKDQILNSRAETICLIKQAIAIPKGKNFLNKWGGSISMDGTGMIRRSQGRLYYADSPEYDNKIPITIEGLSYTLEMNAPGDRIAGFDAETSGPVIGQGSRIRFDQEGWVTFFGNKYRKGGVEVTNAGLKFLSGTEKLENNDVLTFDGQGWKLSAK